METAKETFDREENSRVASAWRDGCEEIKEAIRLLSYGVSLLAQIEDIAPLGWQFRWQFHSGDFRDKMILVKNLKGFLRDLEWEMDANSHITTVEEHPTPEQMRPPVLEPLDWEMEC